MNNHALNILLAEDNEDDVLLIQDAFEEAKRSILNVVRDGEEAMSYLRREGKYLDAAPPSIVLLDINMPKKDGFEVLKEMKADPGLRHLPVVIFTTSDRDMDIESSYAGGACSFITKPLGYDQFVDFATRFLYYWTHIARIPRFRTR